MMIVASNSVTISNVNDGTITHIAYADSADGKDGFYVGGGTNLLSNSRGKFQPNRSSTDNYSFYLNSTVYMTKGQQYTVHADASSGLVWSGTHDNSVVSNNVVLWLTDITTVSRIISDANTGTSTTFTWNDPSGTYYLRVNTYKPDNSGYAENVMLEKGTVAHPWSPAPSEAHPTYMGTYTDFTQADSTNYKDYKWVRILGEAGGEGPAGKDSHTHIAYANSADGTVDFSVSDSSRTYIGMYVDQTATDSTDPASYQWSLIKGADGTNGTPGKAGADGKTPYLHIAYSSSSDGKDGFYSGTPNNLFLNSGSNSGQTTLPSGTPDISGTYSRTDSYEQITPPSSSEYFYRFTNPAYMNNLWGLVAGETYTISGQAVINEGSLTFRSQATGGSGWYNFFGDSTYDLKATNSDGTTYTSFSYTFTIPTGATGIYLSFQAYDYTTNTVFRFKKVKLEKGSTATDWTPNSSEANPEYMGTYTDYTEADSTDYKKYTWTRILGDKGESLNTIKVTSAAWHNSVVIPSPGVWISGEEVAGPGANGAPLYNNWGRGHNLVVLNKDTFKVESVKNYDDYTTPPLADTLATDINALKDKIVIVLSIDSSTTSANLRSALVACGGDPDLGTWSKARYAHAFIGMSKDANGKSVLQPRQGYEIFDSSASAVRTLYASQGGDGIAVNGQTGQSPYLHTAYADSADGTLNFSTDYTEKNILLDTDVPTLTKVDGPANRYFSDGQVDYYGAKIVTITDGVNGSKYASQFTKPNDRLSGKQTAMCWYNGVNPGLKEGHTYKVSAYFRIVDGKGTRARFQIGSGPYDNRTSDFSSNQWTKVEETYTISKALHGDTPCVYIGISSPASSYGTLQMTYPEVTEVSPKYMGTYSDFNEVDSTDPKKYTWVKIQGQSERTHTAWAWSADGSDRFLTSYPKENLLNGTADFSGQAKDHVEILSSNDYSGHKVVHGSVTTALPFGNDVDTVKITTEQNMTGTQYTASFTAWSSTNGTIIGNYFFNPSTTTKSENSQGGIVTSGDGLSQLTLTTTPTRYWVRWTQTSTAQAKTVILGRIGAGRTGDVYITEPTLVEGSEPSSYAPAPSEGKDNAYPPYKGEYRDFLDAQSTNPKDYTWTLVKGQDGAQGTPGKPGADGKTPYFHQAWADSSDGKVGFNTTVSLGKKYLGTYTDYVAADSTDPSKYKWVELAGAIEVGGRNYWIKSTAVDGYLNVNNGGISAPDAKQLLSDYIKVTQGQKLIYQTWVMIPAKSRAWDNYQFFDSQKKTIGSRIVSANSNVLEDTQTHKIINIVVPDNASFIRIGSSYLKNDGQAKLEVGNKPTDWSPAPEDTDKAIDDANSHTDDAINDVNSSVDNIYDVLGNKADADEFKDLQDQAQALQDSYEAFVSDGGQYETDLTNLENRATALYESLGDKLLQLSFINTWMKVGEEGLLIGSEDSSVKMLLGNDQLSFTDGGQTVAYFTAQSFYINKGAVVTSLQVNQHKLSRIDDNHTAFVYTG